MKTWIEIVGGCKAWALETCSRRPDPVNQSLNQTQCETIIPGHPTTTASALRLIARGFNRQPGWLFAAGMMKNLIAMS